MFTAVMAVAITLLQAGDVAQPPLWIEGETPFMQYGSMGLDRPPFGSRGACLGSDWGGRKGNYLTNLDGFFLAEAEFQPPTTRSEIEAVAQPCGAQRRDPNDPACVAEDMKFEDVSGYREDWYYPAEEPAERAALTIPTLHAVADREVSLAASADGQSEGVPVGGTFHGWRVVETFTEPEPMAVLEREFDRWGLIVYLGRRGVVAEIRKAIGR